MADLPNGLPSIRMNVTHKRQPANRFLLHSFMAPSLIDV